MSFKAETYRVLIASPSDLAEERRAAMEAINEWNSLHAAAESVVPLPVRWETHATPQTGVRPQKALNDQLVQTSDILVGMFGRKLAPTPALRNLAPWRKQTNSWQPQNPPCFTFHAVLLTQMRLT